MDSTSEFSFILKPSEHGIGVFAAHDITKGVHLRLFGDEKNQLIQFRDRLLFKREIPELFREYCIDRGESMKCPPDFGCIPIGWYLNHSKELNASRGEKVNDNWEFYATRDILAGEEILIDYNSLDESEEAKESYYRSS